MMTPLESITPLNQISLHDPLAIREQIAARVARGEEIIQQATTADRDFSDAEQAEFDKLVNEIGSDARQTGLHGKLFIAEEKERCQMEIATERINKQHQAVGGGSEFLDVATGLQVRALSNSQRVSNADDISPGRVVASMLLNEPGIMNQNERDIFAQQSGGSDTGGGYLLPSPVSERFVDLARSASVCMRAGAQTLAMDTSELSIARLTSDASPEWREELVAVTSSDVAFDKITLRPKVVAAIIPVSIELLEDAANAASIIESSLQAQLGLKLDQAILSGAGASAEPTGIRNHADVNTITSVGTPTSYSHLTSAIKSIFEANYDRELRDMAWITNPRDGATYDGLADTTGQPLRPTPWAADLRRFSTTSISTTEGGGGNESYMLVGDFRQCLVGMRTSGINLEVLREGAVTDSSGDSWNATTQLLRHVRAYMRVDVALLRPTWFAVLSGVTA
jgi:HK97 family phage major capsid protein